MGSNRRNAANILKGEKEILHYYLIFTNNNMALLKMDWKTFSVATFEDDRSKNTYVGTVLLKLMQKKRVQLTSEVCFTIISSRHILMWYG